MYKVISVVTFLVVLSMTNFVVENYASKTGLCLARIAEPINMDMS